jgi:parallel beta-helix repeat protein
MLLLLLSFPFFGCGSVELEVAASSSVIWVPGNYSTIREAIDAASLGDTILVSAGTYNEYVQVNKSLSIIGEGPTNTTVCSVTSVFEIRADNVTISGFTLDCGWFGSCVELVDSHGCNISNNLMYGGQATVSLYRSSTNIVAYNDIFPQTNGVGIHLLGSSDNNVIRSNYIIRASVGIFLNWGDNNTVIENKVMECHQGLRISSSNHNMARGNSFENNDGGINLWEGAGNRVYHNNLINNPSRVEDTGDNLWDNGAEGNYWDDYNGTDVDGDGIGDTYLPWRGVDHYPLMNPYWNPADINHDLKVNLSDAVLVCSAYGSKPEIDNWNPHCDIIEPYGRVNLYDAVIVCANYGKEFENL